jgi:hypothetical protein
MPKGDCYMANGRIVMNKLGAVGFKTTEINYD